MIKLTLILLAGGKGTRMGCPTPKQYLHFQEKPIACHSLEIFLKYPYIQQYIVVCASQYRSYFTSYPVVFAEPGERRQDSLYNGLQLAREEWIFVHDAARPFISHELIDRLIQEGKEGGAAALAMPVKNTLKECDPSNHVKNTLDRSKIWEIQTPQLLKKEVLEQGFAYAQKHQITVTDDVSLAELIGHPVKLIRGSYQNIKITTPEDLVICESIGSRSPMMEQIT